MQPNTNNPQPTPNSEQPGGSTPPAQPVGPAPMTQQQAYGQPPMPQAQPAMQPNYAQAPQAIQRPYAQAQPVAVPSEALPPQQAAPAMPISGYPQTGLESSLEAAPPQSPIAAGYPQPVVNPLAGPAMTPAQPTMAPTGSTQMPGMNPGKPKKKWPLFAAAGGALVVIAGIIVVSLVMSRVPTVDEATFEKNLAACKRSITYAPEKEGFGKDTSFKINGKKSGGCGVSVHFGQASNPDDVLAKLSNTSMSCTVDTKNDPEASQLFTNPDKYHCEGTLSEAIKKFDSQ